MIARTVFLLVLAAAPVLAQSPQACPWLNSGTAAKILGSDVTSSVHADSPRSENCHFTSKSDAGLSIEIQIGVADQHPCGSGGTALTGIGNQAVFCSHVSDGRHMQTISGRVRDAWFVITMSALPVSGSDRHSSPEESVPSPIELIAEQVTGNLF
jgi:hypothetical protein